MFSITSSSLKLTSPGKYLSILAATLLITGCAADKRAYQEGVALIDQGQIEEGLAMAEAANKQNPNKLRYRMDLLTLRTNAVNRLLLTADSELSEGKSDEAEKTYLRALKLDKENPRAKAGLNMVSQARKHAELIVTARSSLDAGDLDAAEKNVRHVLMENPGQREARALANKIEDKRSINDLTLPTLRPYKNLITLEFRDAGIKTVFDILSKTTGINFILDKDLRPEQRVSIFVKQVELERALNSLLDTNQLGKKVVNDNTVLVYARTPQKIKDYQDLMVKTFYLSNADPKQIANMIKTILKVRDIFVDERLNLLVMRDTPETIQLVEKLIASQDLPDPEVLLEVTVMEIKRDRLLDLGIQYPLQFGVLNATPTLPITVDTLLSLSRSKITASPSPTITAQTQTSNADILANPRIRVRNREKAKVHIGDRVPIITTSGNQNNTGFISENVQYVDVGIKLEVEPNIYLEGDVAIKVGLEVSSLGTKTTTNNGSVVYQVGTRNASTLLRLKDGETQLLAGLINDEDRHSVNGLPGLANLPLIGRLFSAQQDNKLKTEVVLAITPHLMREIKQPGARVTQFWSGTEGNTRTGFSGAPLFPMTTEAPATPQATPPAAPNTPAARQTPGIPSDMISFP